MDGVRLLSWRIPFGDAGVVDWDAVFTEELPRVYGYFRYRGFDRETAEDLASATFEKAWRGRDGYRRERAGISTWLLRIARNTAIDHLRRPRAEVPLEAGDAPRDERTPEADVVRADECRRLRVLVAGLPERERELLALKYGAGATNRAIAALTGLGESNVGTILHRAITALRARFDEGGRS
jgi:RNA polymerase sigma-70 factor (ECF subfamily)